MPCARWQHSSHWKTEKLLWSYARLNMKKKHCCLGERIELLPHPWQSWPLIATVSDSEITGKQGSCWNKRERRKPNAADSHCTTRASLLSFPVSLAVPAPLLSVEAMSDDKCSITQCCLLWAVYFPNVIICLWETGSFGLSGQLWGRQMRCWILFVSWGF